MGRDPFKEETFDVTAHSVDIKENFEAMEEQEVSVAGRIMAKRRMGADIKIKCMGCDAVIMMERPDFERKCKRIVEKAKEIEND